MRSLVCGIALSMICLVTGAQEKLKVYIDCGPCDMDYLKRRINWLEYVRDPSLADMHIWSRDQQTGSGGSHYIFHFSGHHDMEKIQFELDYHAPKVKSDLEIQNDFTKLIMSGSLPFIAQQGNLPTIGLENLENETAIDPEKDFWKNWVFDVGMDIGAEVESNRKDLEMEGMIRTRHTTEKWRIRSELEYELEQNEVHREDVDFVSTLKNIDFEASTVRSINDHWSTGIFLDIWNNSVRNTRIGTRLNAALEYNIFPYWKSHQKEFTLAYYLGPVHMNYLEETIYEVTSETIIGQQLSVEYRLLQPWGSLELELDGSHYLNDPSKHRINLEASTRIRVFKGLSVRISGEYQMIRDQIYLPKGTASLEEILLRRKSIATDFEADFYVGIVYTFGSIYNSTVNTRL